MSKVTPIYGIQGYSMYKDWAQTGTYMGGGGGGGGCYRGENIPFGFCFLACLSERLFMYEDTPTPCIGNWHNFFEEAIVWAPTPPRAEQLYQGWHGINSLHLILKHPHWKNIAYTPWVQMTNDSIMMHQLVFKSINPLKTSWFCYNTHFP